MKEIARLIESDAALAARVLSLSRRADRGVAGTRLSVERAVMLLGLRAVRAIVVSTKVLEVFRSDRDAEAAAFNRTEFWKHCLAVACAARQIARRTRGGIDPDEAFLAGLLHDLGKAALNACIPKSYERVMTEAERRRGDILLIERQVLGTDHTVAGRRVAERWQLPSDLVECIWLHHLPPTALPGEVRSGMLVSIVWLANVLARTHRLGFSGDHGPLPALAEAGAPLGLSEAACNEVLSELPAEIAARAEWIGLEGLTDSRIYVDALAESTQELARLNDDIHAKNQQLSRTAEYFAAMMTLNRGLSPTATVAEACAACATALRQALGVAGVVVFVRHGETGTTLGACAAGDPLTQTHLMESTHPASAAADLRQAAELAQTGVWLSHAPAGVADVAAQHRSLLGAGAVWMMPIVRERECVGAALLAAATTDVAKHRCEGAELEALSSAMGLSLAHARAHADAARLGEGLAWTQQRLSAAQDELAAARSLRMTAELAAGAAHELNNPLAIISGRAQQLKAQSADSESSKRLDDIVTAAHRTSDIISDLMAFAEPSPAHATVLDVRTLIERAVARFADAARDMTANIAERLPPVRGDEEHLESALRELLQNAVEATSEGGRIEIKARHDAADESVVIEVSDRGRGMTPAVLARAFDPFFSHRPAGRGRGMGLTRVKRWMETNGGRVDLESTESHGTLARLRIPAHRNS